MAGLCAPLSTLRQYPHGYWRMTRGRCGSLLLHRDGLAPSTPCRSPGALRSTPMNGHRQTGPVGPFHPGVRRLPPVRRRDAGAVAVVGRGRSRGDAVRALAGTVEGWRSLRNRGNGRKVLWSATEGGGGTPDGPLSGYLLAMKS